MPDNLEGEVRQETNLSSNSSEEFNGLIEQALQDFSAQEAVSVPMELDDFQRMEQLASMVETTPETVSVLKVENSERALSEYLEKILSELFGKTLQEGEEFLLTDLYLWGSPSQYIPAFTIIEDTILTNEELDWEDIFEDSEDRIINHIQVKVYNVKGTLKSYIRATCIAGTDYHLIDSEEGLEEEFKLGSDSDHYEYHYLKERDFYLYSEVSFYNLLRELIINYRLSIILRGNRDLYLTKLNSLITDVSDKKEEYIQTIKGFYGEDRVFFKEEESSGLEVFILFEDIFINNDVSSHLMKELIVRFKLSYTAGRFWKLEDFSGTRTKVTRSEYSSSYFHSHLPSSTSLGTFHNFCLGDGPINEYIATFNRNNDLLALEVFLVSIEPFISWESADGGPYLYFSDIKSDGERTYEVTPDGTYVIKDIVKYALRQNWAIDLILKEKSITAIIDEIRYNPGMLQDILDMVPSHKISNTRYEVTRTYSEYSKDYSRGIRLTASYPNSQHDVEDMGNLILGEKHISLEVHSDEDNQDNSIGFSNYILCIVDSVLYAANLCNKTIKSEISKKLDYEYR